MNFANSVAKHVALANPADIEALNAQKTAAEEALAKAEADKAGLEEKVAAMTTEIAALQEAMVALAAEESAVP
jgi:predicted  nucleic acid-binding Zn-ribbon protein